MAAVPGKARILVVDDEPSICRALQIAFSRAGYDVQAVSSADTGLWLLRTEHFDCMIVDLRMPEIRGDELFELGAALQPHLRANTVFTTGDSSEIAQELIGACGCRVVAKPFDLGELLRIVEEMTRLAREA